MSKLIRTTLLVLVVAACTPSSASACCFLPLPWHCGWSWNPFDPCGVFSSNCAGGHCGIRPFQALGAGARFRQQARRSRLPNLRQTFLNRRADRVCARCARLRNQASAVGGCSCGESFAAAPRLFGAGLAPAMLGAGVGTMAAGPVPMTTQVPVTTYRTVTVDRGSYQRVWVPRLVTQRVPQTTYQTRTIWMNQPQPACSPGFSPGSPIAPSTIVPGTQNLPGTFGPTVPSYSYPTDSGFIDSGLPVDSGIPIESGVPLGSPYGGSGIPFGAPISPPAAADPFPGGSGSVPLPPTSFLTRPMRSASLMGLASGIYSDGIRNYDPAHVSAPRLPGVSSRSAVTFPRTPSTTRTQVADDSALDGHFDDWIDVEPSSRSRTASTGSSRVYEPSAYDRRTTGYERRAKSGLFSPVRPGTGPARARFVGQ